MSAVWGAIKTSFWWLVDHWYIPLFILGVILGIILTGGKALNFKKVKDELDVIKAGAEARKLKAEAGALAATTEVERLHEDAVARLDEKQAEEAKELRNDPVALSRFLVRASRRR